MAYENFETIPYDETDESTNITLAGTKVSWAQLRRKDTSHVSDSKGANHFSGDFEHKFKVQFSNRVDTPLVCFWALANAQLNFKALIDSSANAAVFHHYGTTLYLRALENGSLNDALTYTGLDSTTYYITLSRDDGGGTNNTGQYVAEIRITSHSGELKDTLTVDCSEGEQNDFEYIFGCMSYDDNYDGDTDGFTENLDLQEGAPPVGNAGIMTPNAGFWGPTF